MTISESDIAWTVSDMRSEFRKLTGRPSTNQISDDNVDLLIQRAYLHDLPSIIDLQEIQTFFRFETKNDVASYSAPREMYSIGPAYINGRKAQLFQDPEEFYSVYPQNFANNETLATGDGATASFTGTITNTTINPERFIVSDGFEVLKSQERIEIETMSGAASAVVSTLLAHGLSTGDVVQLVDIEAEVEEINNTITTVTVNSSSNLTLDDVDTSALGSYLKGGYLIPISVAVLKGTLGGTGRVDTDDGTYTVTFNTAPASGQAIEASYEYSTVGEPYAILYYGNEFLMTPTPDKAYLVELAVKGKPKALLEEGDSIVYDDLALLVVYLAAMNFLYREGQVDMANLIEPRLNRLRSQARTRRVRNSTNTRSTPSI